MMNEEHVIMWYEFLLEGLKKFSGEIIGLILLAVFWRMFPRLWDWVSKYRKPKKDNNTEVMQILMEIHRQLDAQQGNVKPADTQNSDEEAEHRTEIKRQLETQRTTTSDEDFLTLCKSGDAKKVEKAIVNGVNVNAKEDRYGWTALMYAANYGHTETTKLLLKHGTDINAKNNIGWTSLMLAASNGHTETAELLLKHGANINAKEDRYGWTALMYAANYGYTETAEVLLKHGANINAKDDYGRTALIISEKFCHKETANLLRQYGTK